MGTHPTPDDQVSFSYSSQFGNFSFFPNSSFFKVFIFFQAAFADTFFKQQVLAFIGRTFHNNSVLEMTHKSIDIKELKRTEK